MHLDIAGHALQAQYDPETAQEVIHLDGQRVSVARTFAGTLHAFSAAGASWEVETRGEPGSGTSITAVRRDGETAYERALSDA